VGNAVRAGGGADQAVDQGGDPGGAGERARPTASARSRARRAYPGAAGSVREGIEETLTLTGFGVSGNLKRTRESTNPCESMLEIVRRTQRNVKHWSSGEMALRWTAAGMPEAEKQFRKIIGHRDLATLAIAIERDNNPRRHTNDAHTPSKEAAIVAAI
jgi:hypothetical protein